MTIHGNTKARNPSNSPRRKHLPARPRVPQRPHLPLPPQLLDARQRLHAALRDRDKVAQMMREIGYEKDVIAKALYNAGATKPLHWTMDDGRHKGDTFPLVIRYGLGDDDVTDSGFVAVRNKGARNGMYAVYLTPHVQKGKRKPKSTRTHLGELYAARKFGAKWRGLPQRGNLRSGRLPHAVTQYFLWRLAHLSGVVPIQTSPLPKIPDSILHQLDSETEVAYAAALTWAFGLGRDLFKAYRPEAYKASASGSGTFSQDFRRLLFSDLSGMQVVATIEAEARARGKVTQKKSPRTDQIWKMLAPRPEGSKDGLILRVNTGRQTIYRFGFLPKEMKDGNELTQDAIQRWNRLHVAMKKQVSH